MFPKQMGNFLYLLNSLFIVFRLILVPPRRSDFLLFFNPSDPFAILPNPKFFRFIQLNIHSLTVLFALVPVPRVLPSIRPNVYPIPVLFIAIKFSVVVPAIRPDIFSARTHLVVQPLTLVFLVMLIILCRQTTHRLHTH